MSINPSDDVFRAPRPRTVRRPRGVAPRTQNRRVERGAMATPDIEQLQQERYALWPLEVQQYARAQDATHPLWSCAHRWRPLRTTALGEVNRPTPTTEMQWNYDWPSVCVIYVYGDMGLRELAAASGIAERRMFWASSRYGWNEQRAAFHIMREREQEHLTINSLDEAARTSAIRGTFTEVGVALLRHCLVALNRSADEIEPRDIAPLMNQAIRLIGAGERMPTEFRHSVVDNPNANPQGGTTNNLILTGAAAEQVLNSLAERARVLEQHVAAIPAQTPA